LYRWEEGDFRGAVEDHNYLWGLLEGNIGKATALNSQTEEAMKKKYASDTSDAPAAQTQKDNKEASD
jgi:hypothetical protein